VASDPDFVAFVADQIADDCAITYRKMFGEYGVYSKGVFFGMVCDDRFFVKPTDGGRSHIGEVVEAPPYPGAKPIFLIEDGLEDSEWLSELVRITVRELPPPKRRKSRKTT
jgi:TfoX/Sxy family transcriptional regulator of competence genes